MSNHIYISGEINEESFREFSETLDEHSGVVEVILNSSGGNAIDAIAFFERIRIYPHDVNITVYGLAGSAAVLILAGCDYRRITKESWVYVHEDSNTYKNIHTSSVEKQAGIARMFEDQWSLILEELTGTSKEKWSALHKEDLYISPKDCVLLGLVDEVI